EPGQQFSCGRRCGKSGGYEKLDLAGRRAAGDGGRRAAQNLFSVTGESAFRGDQEEAVFIKRPFLRSMQVIDVNLVDGKAESGDVLGDALGAEQNVASETLRPIIIVVVVKRRTAIVLLGGWFARHREDSNEPSRRITSFCNVSRQATRSSAPGVRLLGAASPKIFFSPRRRSRHSTARL